MSLTGENKRAEEINSREILDSAYDSRSDSDSHHHDEGKGGLVETWRVDTDEEPLPIIHKPGWRHKLAKVLWDSADKTKEERAFLLKLDAFFLSSICAGYFIKTLNYSNVNYSYLNGMQEHLDLKGNEFNIIQTCWTVGYIVGQVPSQLILNSYPARYYLASLELIWTALTFLTVTCNSYSTMCAMRFFVGLTEAGFFPGVEYLIGSWYSSDEITKRSTIFALSGVAASMITGYLQAAVISGLSHTGLEPAYKWLFIIDGIISFPVAFYTMLANPNTPETNNSWYFTDRDREIALLRQKRGGLGHKKKIVTWESTRQVFSTWHVYVFPLVFLAYNNACNVNSQPAFQDWLKVSGYSSKDYNVYPATVNAAGIGVSLVVAWIADWFNGTTWPFVYLFFICEIIGCSILAAWDIPDGLKWFCYYLTGAPTAWGQPMIFAWLNQLVKSNNEVRVLLVVLTNNLAYVTNAFVPIFTWNAGDMPEYFIGFTYTAALCAFGIIMTTVAVILARRRS